MSPSELPILTGPHCPRKSGEAWIPFLRRQDWNRHLSLLWLKLYNAQLQSHMQYVSHHMESGVRKRKPVLRKRHRVRVGRENSDSIVIPGLTRSSESHSSILRIHLAWLQKSCFYLGLYLYLGDPHDTTRALNKLCFSAAHVMCTHKHVHTHTHVQLKFTLYGGKKCQRRRGGGQTRVGGSTGFNTVPLVSWLLCPINTAMCQYKELSFVLTISPASSIKWVLDRTFRCFVYVTGK